MIIHKLEKIEASTPKTLIVGVDIAKNIQWVQFTDFRGRGVSKHISFGNNLVLGEYRVKQITS